MKPPNLSLGLDDDMPTSSVRPARRVRPTGASVAVNTEYGEIVVRKAWAVSACPACGAEVIAAHDTTTRAAVLLDAAPSSVLVIGESGDGRPLVARPSNCFPIHVCPGRA